MAVRPQTLTRHPETRRRRMTRREHEIMRLVSDGLSVREIAAHLHVSHHTVKSHLKNASAKLKAQNGKHAVALYVRSHG